MINHSSKVTTEDHAHEVRGAAGLFSWDFLFQLRSPLSLKAGEQVFIQYDLNKSNADMAPIHQQILRCGPPPMNKAMAAHLDALGYSAPMQFQF
ncbi:hypothetical protein ACS0TY_010992 [Phlomoides rotata]